MLILILPAIGCLKIPFFKIDSSNALTNSSKDFLDFIQVSFSYFISMFLGIESYVIFGAFIFTPVKNMSSNNFTLNFEK